NLFRGAGPAGLASIPWKRRTDGTTVIRPLLGCRREELIQELQRLEQDWRHDPSNDDTTPNRNWLRHELLPLVAGRLNPNLAETLAGTADLMAGLNRWISTQVDELGIVDPARIPLETLQSAPEMLRRAAVRECLRSVRGNLGSITLRHIDAVLGLSVKQTGRRVDLPGLRAEREFDALVLYRPDDDVEPFSVPLQVPGTTGLPGIGKAVSIEILRTSSNGQQAANTALLSPPPGPLIARNRLPGDRYRIKGRPEKRAKRLLSESRVPRRQRDRLVFIVSGNRLLWIEGFPPNADFLRDFETSLQVTVQSFPAAGG
ncbi:MAG: tRNA lysidine(34) synthetase TilS, partial [Myxococcota bacterium]